MVTINAAKFWNHDRYDDTADLIADFRKERNSLDAVMKRVEGRIPARKDGTFSRAGLEKLVLEAQAFFTEATGVSLPSNLENGGPYAEFKFMCRTSTPGAERIIEETARFSGWLRYIGQHAEELTHAMRFIKITQGSRRGSKDTYADLWTLAKAYPNPHRFDSMVKRTLWHANQLCALFGLKPAWEVIGAVLTGKASCSPRRAGKRIAFGTLKLVSRRYETDGFTMQAFNGFNAWNNESQSVKRWAVDQVSEGRAASLKDALERKGQLVEDYVDGVTVCSDVNRHYQKRGFCISPGYNQDGLKVTLFRLGDRTFHSYGHEAPDSNYGILGAIRAFRQQDRLLDSIDYDRNNYCPLVYAKDSWDAGNCVPGTDAWIRRLGLTGKFVPLETLLALDPRNERVINTCFVAVERLHEWVAEQ